MSTMYEVAPDHWIVHTGEEGNSEVIVELRMSRDEAARLIASETTRLARANPGNPIHDQIPQNVGFATLMSFVRSLDSGTRPATPSPAPPSPPQPKPYRQWIKQASFWGREFLRWLPYLNQFCKRENVSSSQGVSHSVTAP